MHIQSWSETGACMCSTSGTLLRPHLWLAVIEHHTRVTGGVLPIPCKLFVSPLVLYIGVAFGRAVNADHTRAGCLKGDMAYCRDEVKVSGTPVFRCLYQECGRNCREDRVITPQIISGVVPDYYKIRPTLHNNSKGQCT